MKEKFENPEMEIIRFQNMDVITASNCPVETEEDILD